MERRNILKFVSGSAAGLALTPVPWKLLDDTAIWSQNWSWIPRPLRGETGAKFTHCTLCPAGCGVKARTVGTQPVALAGVAGHPRGAGFLCAEGICGHHLAYHPNRVRGVRKRGQPVAAEAAVREIAAAISAAKAEGTAVGVFDERPGRCISTLYRRFTQSVAKGVYLTTPNRPSATLEALARICGVPATLGVDLESVRTLISFGAPLMDGWSTPGRVASARGGFRLIQAEPRLSATASSADLWLPLKPGTELALAFGIANLALREKSGHEEYRRAAARFTPEEVGRTTGVAVEAIERAAKMLLEAGPAIALGGGDPGGGPLGEEEEVAIAGLNVVLGGLGAFIPRREEASAAADVTSVPDGSLRVLLCDGNPAGTLLPWGMVKRKLAKDALVVSLSAFVEGLAKHADFIVATPGPFESMMDVPSAFDAPAGTFAVSAPLYPAPKDTMDPAAFLAQLAASSGLEWPEATTAGFVRSRMEAIHRGRRGKLHPTSGDAVAVGDLSAEEFAKALEEGGCWVDDREKPLSGPVRSPLGGLATERFERLAAGRVKPDAAYAVQLVPYGHRGAAGNSQLSPMMTKLYTESDLRDTANTAAVHPETAQRFGLEEGCAAQVETRGGSCEVRVRVDAAAMPGVVEVAMAPARTEVAAAGRLRYTPAAEICGGEWEGIWRAAAARIRRV